MDIEQQIKEYLLGKYAELKRRTAYSEEDYRVLEINISGSDDEPELYFKAYLPGCWGEKSDTVDGAINVLIEKSQPLSLLGEATRLRNQAAELLQQAEALERGAA